MSKILVTGADGFIGSHLVEHLVRQGRAVRAFVLYNSFNSFGWLDAAHADVLSAIEFVEGDIRDPGCIDDVFNSGDIDIVVHLAARAGVRPSIEDPAGYQDVNITGTNMLLEGVKRYGIGKFIFASSSSIYGNNKKVPFSESDNVDFPISPYAATKKAGELICHTYSHLYDIDMTCLRFFTVYGPRQRPDLAIHKFCKLIEAGQAIPVFGDGSMMRDFTYIDDILDGVAAAMKKLCGYEIYNLGQSQPVRLDELIDKIEKALGKKAVIERFPMQPGDVIQTYADVTKAKERLGYEPRTELSVGLKRFVEWLRGCG